MSTLGGRLALAALAALEACPGDGLVATYHAATCAADGIAEVTGCSVDAGSFEVVGGGRHMLRLRATNRPAVVEVELRPAVLERAAAYRDFDQALQMERAGLSASELRVREGQRLDLLDEILGWLWNAPQDELVCLRRLSRDPERMD